MEADYGADIAQNAVIIGKQERQDAFDATEEAMMEKYLEQDGEELFEENEPWYKEAYEEIIRRYVRDSILHKHLRGWTRPG